MFTSCLKRSNKLHNNIACHLFSKHPTVSNIQRHLSNRSRCQDALSYFSTAGRSSLFRGCTTRIRSTFVDPTAAQVHLGTSPREFPHYRCSRDHENPQGHTVTVNVTQSRTVTAMSAIVIIPTAVESSSPASAASNSPAPVASSGPTAVESSMSTTVASSSPTTTPSYNGKGDCSPRPPGQGPMPRVDSASSFRNYPEFSVYAASAPVPENYTKVYADKLATNTGGKYMGYQMLKTYSTRDCANTCDQQPGCRAFNIFFERTPAVNIGRNCTDSPSSTTIKCALWDWRLSPADATNSGSKLWDFEGK
jgi:hypothetical protein